MPTPQLKDLAKQSGKSLADVEKAWAKSAQIADDMGKKNNYGYRVGIVKNMLGIEEAEFNTLMGKFLAEKFVESKLSSWDQFIEELTSGDFTVTPEVVADTTQNKDREEREKKEDGKY